MSTCLKCVSTVLSMSSTKAPSGNCHLPAPSRAPGLRTSFLLWWHIPFSSFILHACCSPAFRASPRPLACAEDACCLPGSLGLLPATQAPTQRLVRSRVRNPLPDLGGRREKQKFPLLFSNPLLACFSAMPRDFAEWCTPHLSGRELWTCPSQGWRLSASLELGVKNASHRDPMHPA